VQSGVTNQRERELLEWSLGRIRGVAFHDVPVSGPAVTTSLPVDPERVEPILAPLVVVERSGRRGQAHWANDPDAFATAIASSPATIVVAAKSAGRYLFGRLICRRDLLARAYPKHRRLDLAVAVDHIEPNMRWFYDKHGITVWVRGDDG
jgi:hypothetical protein